MNIEDEIKEAIEALQDVPLTIKYQHCIRAPFGCGRHISLQEIESWSPLEYKEYSISALCNVCQGIYFKDTDD